MNLANYSALIAVSVTLAAGSANAVPSVIPLPAKIIAPAGGGAKNAALKNLRAIVCQDAHFAKLASDTVCKWSGVRLPIRPDVAADAAAAPVMRIEIVDPATVGAGDAPELRNKEGYTLTVAPSGGVTIRASTQAGAFYALQTLVQLLAPGAGAGADAGTGADAGASANAGAGANAGASASAGAGAGANASARAGGSPTLPVVEIADAPRFAWRGILLDECRHFFGKDAVKRLIDTMVLFKYNTLHWHLTDDQGWRIEIKKYPRLTQTGSWRASSPTPGDRNKPDGVPHGGYYTQDDIREIVAYARANHVMVIPEIEIPGHSSAALAAYPRFGNTDIPGYAPKVQTTWGVHPYTYAPKEETFAFLAGILDEVCALFPDAPCIHAGGDEAPKTQWDASAFAKSVMKKNNLKDSHELQSWFVRRIEQHLNTRGRQLIGWDEIQEGGLSPTAIMMVWRDWKWAVLALEKGNKVIMTPKTHCYLDYTQGNTPETPYWDNPGRWQKPPRVITLEKAYAFEPLPEGMPAEREAQILGCQSNLWTEYIQDWPKAEYFLFPRAIAIAEVAWSRKDARDWQGFQARLPNALRLLDRLRVNYQMPDGTGAPARESGAQCE